MTVKKRFVLCIGVFFLMILAVGYSLDNLPKEVNQIKVTPTSDIKLLENGISTVRYDGDYGFDQFLTQGGADSDSVVLKFLTENLISDSQGLQMQNSSFGCSTISAKNRDGGYLFGRNFDWQKCNAMVVASYPTNGYNSISTVNMDFIRKGAGIKADFLPDKVLTLAALYAPLDGMNEKGLCVSVNMIQDSDTINQVTQKPDLTTTTAIRLLLDKASTVEEALNLLNSYDIHSSMNIMVHFSIADAAGKSVAVEYIENKMTVTETPILTNFYVSEGKKYGIGTKQSHTRFDILEKTLADNVEMNFEMVRDALDSVSKDNFGEFESTEWSIVFDQKNLTACYFHRENYSRSYYFELN